MGGELERQASIIRRLDAALDDMRAEGLIPEAFYLTEHDREQFDEAASKAWGGTVYGFSHRDVQFYSLKRAPANLPHRQQGRSILKATDGSTRRIAQRVR